MLEHKAVPVNGVEVVDAGLGIVAAIVSVTGLNDRVKDNILPGAYTQTLLDRTPKGIWHHDWKIPVSRTIKIVELMPGDKRLPKKLPDGRPWPAEAGALHVVTQFNLETQRGREAYSDVVFFGADQEWSIGYRVPPGKSENRGGIRFIKMLDLFEYSPVLFGAMPAARTITSVKDAQESWLEMKGELFGSCGDGEGTCCLACGDKVDIEAKADHVHDDLRWVVDFNDAAPEGVPNLVGSFGTKHAATDWVDVFTKTNPDIECEINVRELVEMKADDEGPEPGFDAFMAAFMELVEDLEPDEIEGKALIWHEGKHKRGTNGRFIKKVGDAMTAVRQDVRDTRAGHERRRNPATRFDSARSSYKRSRDHAYAAEVKLAKVQRREPSRKVSDFAATLWASRHLSFDERNGGEFGRSLGVDLNATREAAALDLARGDKGRATKVSRMLAKLQSITVARPTPQRPRVDPEIDRVLGDIGDRRAPAKRVGMDYARPQGGDNGSTPLPPTPDLPPTAEGARVPRPVPPGLDDGGAELDRTSDVIAAIEANRRRREAERVPVRRDAELRRGEDRLIDFANDKYRKDDMDDIETKRYTSGWDEAKHPRDAEGKFTDSPGEAAMRQSLQRMQRGAESATDALSRLQMDEGDVDEVSQAYFNSRVTPARVNPDAPRMLQGNPGDDISELTDVAHADAVNNAVLGSVRAQLAAHGAGPRLGLDREDTYKLQLLVGGIEMGRGMENPDDRLQMATSMMSGKDYVKTYDDLMVSLNEPKRTSRKTDRAKVMAEALQVDMMATFGQGWKERLDPITGPPFDQSWKREKTRRRKVAVAGGVIGGLYAGALAAIVVAGKADPAEGDTPDPQAAAGAEPDPMAPPPPLIEQTDVLQTISLPEPIESILHRFDLSALAAPETAPDAEAITVSATLDAINLDEAEEGDDEGFPEDEADPLAGLEPGEPELDAPEGEEPGETVEEPEDPAEEAEEKSWGPLDDLLDDLHPEDAFPAIDEVKSDDPDGDGDLDDIEGFADDIIQALFGDWQDDEPEEKRFDPSSHPRGPDGRFVANGGAGGKLGAGLRSANRGLQYANKIDPTRKKRSVARFRKAQKPLWRRERLVAKLQKRKPSRQLVKLEAAMHGAAVLAPDERADYLDSIGINLNDMRRNIARDFRNNGASPRIQERVDKNMATLIDLWFRSEAGYKGPESKSLDVEFDADALMADMHAKAELVALDELIADWDEEHVFDLMSKMSPDELEELIEGVETKAAPISEATGGLVAQPGKGNKGNIKPIMRWFEVGEGAAKIRWGTSGDFMRCVRLAEKHMNPEHAKGFCNKRHVAVLGSAPGQGHKSDEFDMETKCLLCTGDIVGDTCLGCEGDWSQKGFRRFVENMVERSNDGKFAPKAGGGGGGKTGVVRAGGGVVPAPKASPPAKKKTTIERRVGKAVVKGGAKLVVHHPKTLAAAGAGFALGRRSKGNKSPAQGGAAGGGRAPGGQGTGLSGIQQRGKADSWVDTIDALADMAGDSDSLLNHMIDKGIAKQRNGDFHVNMKMPDIGGMKTRMVGTFDARKVKSTMGMLKNTLTPELGGGQRALPAGAPPPPPALGSPVQLSLPFEAMTIDLDRDVIDLDGETVKIGDSKGFARHLDSNYRNERKKARKLSDQELRDFANEPTRDGTNEDDAAYLDELADRQRASAAKVKKVGETGTGPVDRAAQAVAKPLIKRDEKKKKAEADFTDVMSRLDRLKDTSTEKEFDDAMAKVRETSANLTDEDRAKIQEVFAKKKRDAASAAKAKKVGETGTGLVDRAARAVAKPLINRDQAKKKVQADLVEIDALLASAKRGTWDARVKEAEKDFRQAHDAVEGALRQEPTPGRDEYLRGALDRRTEALSKFRKLVQARGDDLAKEKPLAKADGVEDLELKDGDIVLTEDDVWMLRAVVSRLKL